MVQPTFSQGPFLQAAFLCEQVLDEKDGVKSAIRIVDRLIRSVSAPEPPEVMEPFDYTTKMLLKFKSGSARGSQPLSIRLEKPSGESLPPDVRDVYFEGGGRPGGRYSCGLRYPYRERGPLLVRY